MNTDIHGWTRMRTRLSSELETATEKVLGAAFEVSNRLGHGFLEAVYRRALVHELEIQGVAVQQEVPFDVEYKGRSVGRFQADLVIANKVIVELKAVEALGNTHVAQVVNYLKATGLDVGLLINFGKPRIEYRRVLPK